MCVRAHMCCCTAGVNRVTKESVAVKILAPNVYDSIEMQDVAMEIANLAKFSNHPNVAQFFNAYKTSGANKSVSLWCVLARR